MSNDLFNSAVQNLDTLTKAGIFGDVSQNLLMKRGKVSTQEFNYLSFLSIYDDPEFDRQTIPYTLAFMDLFTKAMLADSESLKHIMTASWIGTKELPQLETMSSYTRFLTEHRSVRNASIRLSDESDVDALQRIELAHAILHDYANGFEYCMKLFTFILAVEQIIKGKKYDLQLNDKQPSSNKLNLFRQLDGGEHSLLVDGWDARLRNADSHIDILYNPQTFRFEGKNKYYEKVGSTKVLRNEEFTVTPAELLTNITPQVGRFIQGYIGASQLLYLVKEGREYYNKAASLLEELSD